jgi:purine-nucleoside phosphorylase
MSADQLRGAKTNQSVWSVVNGLTHFATHNQDLVDTNVQASDETNMMIQAGNLFGKKSFDNENMMPDLFDKNVLNKTVQTGALLN